MTDSVTCEAPAKVNLFLRVLGRASDGYHEIETLLALTTLADTITVERRGDRDVTIEVNGADAGPPQENLALRAARAVLDATGQRFGVHIRLEKRIPVRAGLGGGSSDAAQALLATNQLAGNAVPRHELLQLAGRLGSDVPFLLSGARIALGWHRGERTLRLPPLPRAEGLLLIPPVGVRTSEAYTWVSARHQDGRGRGSLALDLDALASWGDVARMAGNDFEAAVFEHEPLVRTAFDRLVATAPMLCRMSGSGSALLALYRNARDRDDARMQLGRKLGLVQEVQVG